MQQRKYCCWNVSNLTQNIHLIFLFKKGPWLHVGYFFVGMYAGNKYVQVERQMVDDINQIRQDKGMPPMVGTNAWIRYTTTEE